MVSPEFLRAFRTSYGCMDECCCGRFHYDLEGRWGWEEGELEQKRQLIKEDPDRFLAKTADSWLLDVLGKRMVAGCPCKLDEKAEATLMAHLDSLRMFTNAAVEARAQREQEEKDRLQQDRMAACPGGWQLIDTAPQNASWFEALTDPTAGPIRVHWAQDLSGEEQPPFRGFFRKTSDHSNEQVTGLKYWRPLPETRLNG